MVRILWFRLNASLSTLMYLKYSGDRSYSTTNSPLSFSESQRKKPKIFQRLMLLPLRPKEFNCLVNPLNFVIREWHQDFADDA